MALKELLAESLHAPKQWSSERKLRTNSIGGLETLDSSSSEDEETDPFSQKIAKLIGEHYQFTPYHSK